MYKPFTIDVVSKVGNNVPVSSLNEKCAKCEIKKKNVELQKELDKVKKELMYAKDHVKSLDWSKYDEII